MSFDLPFELPDFDISSLEGLATAFFYGANLTGAVMGKLGMFPFFMHQTAFQEISKQLQAEFSRYKPIKGQVLLGDSGGFSETLTLKGVLVAMPTATTKPLEWYLKIRKPLRFTTMVHDENIVIVGLTKTQNNFSIQGRHRVETYDISLEVIYGTIL